MASKGDITLYLSADTRCVIQTQKCDHPKQEAVAQIAALDAKIEKLEGDVAVLMECVERLATSLIAVADGEDAAGVRAACFDVLGEVALFTRAAPIPIAK